MITCDDVFMFGVAAGFGAFVAWVLLGPSVSSAFADRRKTDRAPSSDGDGMSGMVAAGRASAAPLFAFAETDRHPEAALYSALGAAVLGSAMEAEKRWGVGRRKTVEHLEYMVMSVEEQLGRVPDPASVGARPPDG